MQWVSSLHSPLRRNVQFFEGICAAKRRSSTRKRVKPGEAHNKKKNAKERLSNRRMSQLYTAKLRTTEVGAVSRKIYVFKRGKKFGLNGELDGEKMDGL